MEVRPRGHCTFETDSVVEERDATPTLTETPFDAFGRVSSLGDH
jgi:hypothetical protein